MEGKRGSLTKKQLATLPGHKLTIAERQVNVARLYAQGYSQAEIGEQIGQSHGQVSKDLAKIKARWVEMSILSMGERRGRELDRIDWMEWECQEAWERSKELAVSTKVTTEKMLKEVEPEVVNGRIPGKNGKKGKKDELKVGVKVPNLKLEPVRKYIERSEKGQTGDVRFLQQIAWCIEMRLKIFGVLEEKKGDVNILNLNWEQLESKVRQQAPDVVEERLRLEASKVTNGG